MAQAEFSVKAHEQDNFEGAIRKNFSVPKKQIIEKICKFSTVATKIKSNSNGNGLY